MNTNYFDTTNAHDLVGELDKATEIMMALHVGQVGGEQWRDACSRQQSAFMEWRQYLYRKADEKPPARLLSIG
ncbi:hypothetical protein GE543_15040 [Pseudomonas sp. SZ57]|uniref:Uncharacterized protein n=3 Tax=Pseudomonas syringae group TaxID=136849 RepID=A0AAW5JEJ4_PSESS|nr:MULTISPECIES: hypothetical protein [Pseudomonas]ARD12864.1 hypothetical protein PSA3335_18465 [Pseudomonas savastanoi pv. savastanoi NCPPB 3335]KAA3536619.1 hypothetical protein DXU85_23075 [Pseudomonas savastanoi]KTB78695.1 hypothetical protein AO069_05915 [Pseudomonas syringae pv. syringae PD2774]KWS08271.1 hypothetical protein AL064_02020 [Pseudomonas syringae pv. syringae]KWS21146.1 hypothetical protein AL062_20385 [Pseudomonas syringae pv. syringae]